MTRIKSCLGFMGDAEEAVNFYVSVIPNSEIKAVLPGSDGPIAIDFTLDGLTYTALNGIGGAFNPSISLAFTTEDQDETDRIWDAFIESGGEAGRCGWLKDKWGLSWQIIPRPMYAFFQAKDKAAAMRAQTAMFQMTKIDLNVMQAAFDAEGSGGLN